MRAAPSIPSASPVELALNTCPSTRAMPHVALAPFGPEAARAARAFHASLPGYAATPLYSLDTLAARLGLGRVLIKDESRRVVWRGHCALDF